MFEKTKVSFVHYFADLIDYQHIQHAKARTETVQGHNNDLLCLEKALVRFVNENSKENAFDVYYCFCSTFRVFGSGDEAVQRVLNLLCAHEMGAGTLSLSHRDHYTHSVSVFYLGLELYSQSKAFRAHYAASLTQESVHLKEKFLLQWGMTALFHDIGYPYELAFTQIRGYNESIQIYSDDNPCVSFNNLDAFAKFDITTSQFLTNAGYPCFTLDEFLAPFIADTFHISKTRAEQLLFASPRGNKHMDHAYFSATLLSKILFDNPTDLLSVAECADILSAIASHNAVARILNCQDNLFEKNPFVCDNKPLTYLLLVCDALQNYGRDCYGKNNKLQNYPFDCTVCLNETFTITYFFDYHHEIDIERFMIAIKDDIDFLDLESCFGKTTISYRFAEKESNKNYSYPSFYNDIITFAQVAHDGYCRKERESANKIFPDWNALSLEYRMSNILQIQSYSQKLHSIGCFFSKQSFSFPERYIFNAKELMILSEGEHERWLQEKTEMGWTYGTTRDDEKGIHPDMIDYHDLSSTEKKKDTFAFNYMLKNLIEYGYAIYCLLDPALGDRRILGVTGHINMNEDRDVTDKLMQFLTSQQRQYGDKLVMVNSLSDGADQICAEMAMAMGIPIIGILPMEEPEYLNTIKNKDLYIKLSAYCEYKLILKSFNRFEYYRASHFIAKNCHELLALWDEKQYLDAKNDLIGGTWHTVDSARKYGKKVSVLKVTRQKI